MDKKTIQASLLILGVFMLGLATGVGGAVWLGARRDHHRPLRPMSPPGPPDEVDEARSILPELDPAQRERVEELIFETSQATRAQAGTIRQELDAHTDTFFAELRIAAPGADIEHYAASVRELLGHSRRRIPPPPHLREDFVDWLDGQEIPESQRSAAMDAADRYFDHYWESFRALMELSAKKRREVRELIGGELTDEQRRTLRERFRQRREAGPPGPPPHHRPPPPPLHR